VYVANQGLSYPHNMPSRIDSKINLLAAREGGGSSPPHQYANGLADIQNGRQLIVAGSFGHRLWRLPVRDDGCLASGCIFWRRRRL
jgi:hypothetical protein